jgi:hypothetical protein
MRTWWLLQHTSVREGMSKLETLLPVPHTATSLVTKNIEHKLVFIFHVRAKSGNRLTRNVAASSCQA